MNTKFTDFLAVTKSKIKDVEKAYDKTCDRISTLNSDINTLDKCRDIMNAVGVTCQENMKEVIESLVSKALQAVFGPDYSFVIKSEVVRNKPEIYMYVARNGQEFSMRDELGGGVIDLVSFVIRVVFWSLQTPRSSEVIILDEPGKFISKDLQEVFGDMIVELSELLGIQFIIITHEDELKSISDHSYEVYLRNGISRVEKI